MNVDSLDAVESGLAIGAEEYPRSHFDNFVGDAKGMHPPGDIKREDDDEQHSESGERCPSDEPGLDQQIYRILLSVPGFGHEELDESLSRVRDEKSHDREKE